MFRFILPCLFRKLEDKGWYTGFKTCGSLYVAKKKDRMFQYKRMKAASVQFGLESKYDPFNIFYSIFHIFICSFVHLFICSFVHLFICSFVHLFIRVFVCSCIRVLVYSFVHSFVRSFISLFVNSLIIYLLRILTQNEVKEYCGLIRTDDLLGGLWVPGVHFSAFSVFSI